MIRRSRLIECFGVTAIALGGEPEAIELSDGADFVAGVAVDDGVCTDQRKAILVLIDVVDGDLPAIGVVAQFAFSPIFAAMQIGMAILALVGSIGEIEIGMTVAASDSRVPSAQGEAGLRMVELDRVLDHLPIRRRMAVDARRIEFAMRALRRSERPR